MTELWRLLPWLGNIWRCLGWLGRFNDRPSRWFWTSSGVDFYCWSSSFLLVTSVNLSLWGDSSKFLLVTPAHFSFCVVICGESLTLSKILCLDLLGQWMKILKSLKSLLYSWLKIECASFESVLNSGSMAIPYNLAESKSFRAHEVSNSWGHSFGSGGLLALRQLPEVPEVPVKKRLADDICPAIRITIPLRYQQHVPSNRVLRAHQAT